MCNSWGVSLVLCVYSHEARPEVSQGWGFWHLQCFVSRADVLKGLWGWKRVNKLCLGMWITLPITPKRSALDVGWREDMWAGQAPKPLDAAGHRSCSPSPQLWEGHLSHTRLRTFLARFDSNQRYCRSWELLYRKYMHFLHVHTMVTSEAMLW